ncbi:MAG: PssD/Cps14F family polysaccharide biosynthesis glycosyltransferase [Candidatus Diapherotrites archaeon]
MIMLTCSAGGHLTEMRQLKSFYEKAPHCFITFERPDTISLAEKETVYFITRPARNPITTIRAFIRALSIVDEVKPRMVVSTGADVTVPVCLAAKLRGVPVIFIESYCRPYTPSWSGRIISLFADRVLYQWPSLKKYYPSGVYAGSIFARNQS